MSARLAEVSPLAAVANIYQHYLDLPLLVHPAEDPIRWYMLHRHRRRVSILDVQNNYGALKGRQAYDRRLFRQRLGDLRPRLDQFLGSWDLVVPIYRGRRVLSFLVTGPFYRDYMDEEGIAVLWQQTTGRQADPLDPEYLYLARVVLETPVLRDEELEALTGCLQALAENLAGRGKATVQTERIDRLVNHVISGRLFHIYWAERAMRTDRHFQRAMVGGVLTQWEKQVFNVNREPTRVIAAAVEGPVGQSQVAERALGARFQREMAPYIHKLPDSTGGTLGDNGVFLLTSAPEGKDSALDARDKARALEEWCRKVLGARVRVGAGRDVSKVDDLALSYEEAVGALHRAALENKTFLLHEPSKETKGKLRAAADLGREWAEAQLASQDAGADNLLARFIKRALEESAQQSAPLRVYLAHALHALGSAARRRGVTGEGEWNELADRLRGDLDRALSVEQVLRVFDDWRQRLQGYLEAPGGAHRRLRLQRAREFVDANFRRPLKLVEVAREAGMSETHLSRHFHEAAGMGFERYVTHLRLEQAKSLLRSTGLSASHISDDCGFSSRNYFFQAFKKATGMAPGEFRRG